MRRYGKVLRCFLSWNQAKESSWNSEYASIYYIIYLVCATWQISFTTIPDKAKRAAMRDVIELVTKAEDLIKDYSGDLKETSSHSATQLITALRLA